MEICNIWGVLVLLQRRKSTSKLWQPFFSQYFGRSISPDMLLILANVAPLAQYTGPGFVISSSGFWNSVTFHDLSEFSMSYVKQLFSQVVFPHCFIKCVLEIILLLELQSNLRLRQPLISDQFSKKPKSFHVKSLYLEPLVSDHVHF